MNTFAAALAVLNEMKAEGIIEEYALAGAMAAVFWAEPVATYDLDVLVWLPNRERQIMSLTPLYDWLSQQGCSAEAEHVLISGVPVQFIPAHNELADETITEAATLDYEGIPVRVARPEYLIALYLEPPSRTHRRRERAAALAELPGINRELLADLLNRFGLSW